MSSFINHKKNHEKNFVLALEDQNTIGKMTPMNAAKHDPNKIPVFQQNLIMPVTLAHGCVNLQFGQQTCTGCSSWPGACRTSLLSRS